MAKEYISITEKEYHEYFKMYNGDIQAIADDIFITNNLKPDDFNKYPIYVIPSEPFNNAGERNRPVLLVHNGMNESLSTIYSTVLFSNKDATQRKNMSFSQKKSMTIPIEVDIPVTMSSMEPEILELSSVIQRSKAKTLTLHKVFKYQFRKIYIYEEDGVVKVLDYQPTVKDGGFASPLRTDLDYLEEGETYTLQHKESNKFYKTYPSQFNPNTRLAGYGRNIVSCITVDIANANDSVKASDEFMRKFTSVRTKTVVIRLNRKRLSKIPELGVIYNNPILTEIIEINDEVQYLSKIHNNVHGSEDEIIYIEPNSYIESFIVYANEPLQDPKLEEMRVEYNNFRLAVSSYLRKFNPDKLSNEARVIMEDWSFVEYRSEVNVVESPVIELVINTIDIPKDGFKFSTPDGGKVTVQEIYPHGRYVDEHGTPIDIIYPSTSIYNRMVLATIHNNFLGSVSLHIKRAIDTGILDKDSLYEMIGRLYKSIHLEFEWDYANISKDDLWEFAQNNYIRWIQLPFSHGHDLETSSNFRKILKEYIPDFGPTKVYNVIGGLARELTVKHTVGLMYFFRVKHDTYMGNISCGIAEMTTDGNISDTDTSRNDGRGIYNKVASKADILTLSFLLQMLTNNDAHIVFNKKNETLYSVNEQLEASGIGLGFTDKLDKTKIYNDKLKSVTYDIAKEDLDENVEGDDYE